MCFSAPASFTASAGLAVIGGATIKISKPKDRMLALVPILFSIQQFLEGIQWLYLRAGSASLLAAYAYLFFAYILWPLYVPIFVYHTDIKRRKVMWLLILVGGSTSLYFLISLILNPLSVGILRACIGYDFFTPYKWIPYTGYMISVFAPFFFSSHNHLRWFGYALLVSVVISWLFFNLTFASVWCFFAAILSSTFFLHIKSKQK